MASSGKIPVHQATSSGKPSGHSAKTSCPVSGSGVGSSEQQLWNDKKWPMVRIPADIHVLFALSEQGHPEPYYYMKPGQPARMNRILKQLCAAGTKVEDAVLEAKKLLKNGENPDVIRHALGIYLTHSTDAQRRHIMVPTLKDHALMRTQTTVQPSSDTAVDPGEVTTPDTLQGPAILSYWREDYDYNDHHVHWHMVFPGTGMIVDGKNVKVIDRQGELFLYMHSQMVARYETEGLCWGLPLVRPWNQYDDVLEHGYVPVPGLTEFYGGYPAYSSWFATKNPNIPDTKDEPVPREQLEQWRDNIYQAIKDGYFFTKKPDGSGGKVVLDADNCANLVGVVIEAESAALQVLPDGSSLDGDMYGNLHNFGHDKFAEMGYHNFLTKTNPYSLMISNFGSPRDAAFWPWHKHVQYFGRLAAARFPQDVTSHKADVRLSNLIIRAQSPAPGRRSDGITTVMGPPAINLLESRAKLDHEPYQWSVEIKSNRAPSPSAANPQIITLRMFIAARELMEDYHNWIEMDKASVRLTSASTTQVRLDTDSSVARKMGKYSELEPQWTSSWCRCGWPQNMMLPVGRVDGMEFVAFCMATDDTVDVSVKTPAMSYCGAMQTDRKYPDPRGMGYPFNQEWTQHVKAGGAAKLSTIIADNETYPFMASSSFRIYRTTKPFLDSKPAPPPSSDVTWFSTIKGYFLAGDVVCMLHEYGYDLSDYNDVVLHGAAIYDAVLHKRMPLQMPPYTQENPDPKHPMWTDDMCNNFNAWLQNGCPKGKDPGPPTPPPGSVTWDDTIKGYFLPSDVACMKDAGGFDLSNKSDVVKFASAIYSAVSDGSMPLQMSPYTQKNPDPKHPLWTQEMCNNFKAWMDGGFP